MIDDLVRETRFTTFDGALSVATSHQRPDRFSHLELPDIGVHRIPRGGGYSYSAASFGENALVQEMTCFNRFLEFNPEELTLKLEAGVRLIDLMEWALSRQLYFPVLPGYPLITVGGCIAADVHGKNPYKDGTFSDWVKEITVFHPQKGYQLCSAQSRSDLFAMTCGGYGLTGVITDVTLQLAQLPASSIALSRTRVDSLEAAISVLSSSDADITYSWHDACHGSNFGRGIVYNGRWYDEGAQIQPMRFRPMTADTRASLRFCAWNGLSARCVNTAMILRSRYLKRASVMSILDASFPFASNVYFHKLFGRRGLSESQMLVDEDRIVGFLEALQKLVTDMRAPTMMLSIKRFRGAQKSLSMSGAGYLVAVDCYRNHRTDDFLHRLDELMLEVGGQPNLSKDSRLPEDIARMSIASFSEFERDLFDYDSERTMRSELSARLGLL